MKNLSFFIFLILSSIISAQVDSIFELKIRLPFTSEQKNISGKVIDGDFIIEGDINLGKFEKLKENKTTHELYCDICALWSNSIMPFVIGSGFSSQMATEINNAINFINSSDAGVNICVLPRSGQSDYVKFQPSNGCNSKIGRSGGEQLINLDDISDGRGCYYSDIIHEIFHAAGLWHTHSREDRNNFVNINYNNVINGEAHNFNQHISDGIDIGAYDYNSIMHYGPYDFSSTGQPTITRKNGSTDVGYKSKLTNHDVQLINYIYGTKCNRCGISTNFFLDDPVFHAELNNGSNFFPAGSSPHIFKSNQFGKFDSALYYEFSPGPLKAAVEFEKGSVMEIYIDGCYGK